ncbi:MAG: ATP-binding cassette subfamily B protein RaxB [Oceanicoccus sp.]|jgi:ATP-binding cassette subfamily B protein RaxB
MEVVLEQARPERLLSFGSRHHLPVIVQAEAAECGLVCLAMIAGFYGFETDIVSLRHRYSVSSHGATLKAVMDIAARMHMSSRALRLDVGQLEQLQKPCILHWDMNHFVVLKAIRRRHVIIHDPAIGERKLSRDEFGNHFTGVALELTPTEGFKAGEDKQTLRLGQFWSRIVGLKRSLIQLILLSFLLQLFAVTSPFYMQIIIDDVIMRNDENLLLVLALGFGLLMLIQTGTSLLRDFVVLHVSNRLNIQMAANLFRHLIRLPMDYFYKRHMGDIISRFGSLGSVRQLLTAGLVAAIIDGVMAMITLAAMFFYDVKLTLIVLAVVLLYALLRFSLYRPLRLLTEEGIVAAAKHDSHFIESIRAIQTIKLFQRENSRQSEWQNRLADSLNKGIRIARCEISYGTISSLLFGLENLIVIYFAATAVMDNIISLGMLYAFMSYKGRFVASMDALIGQWIELKMVGLHLDRLSDIVFTPAEDIDQHDTLFPSSELSSTQKNESYIIQGRIEARNLSYSFGGSDQPVFHNISFIIEPGETVAITGPSGCGKTTLLKCLMGLLSPSEGELLVDGKPLNQLSHYRSQIAGVMQDDQLMSGSIADNIACFSPQLDMERIISCSNMACIHDEIILMPMQYNTLVGDMGANLSGGQKQRVVLARALYREPRILFMDEATSNLDVKKETLVNEHIQGLAITRILVAHRPETVRFAGKQIELVGHTG